MAAIVLQTLIAIQVHAIVPICVILIVLAMLHSPTIVIVLKMLNVLQASVLPLTHVKILVHQLKALDLTMMVVTVQLQQIVYQVLALQMCAIQTVLAMVHLLILVSVLAIVNVSLISVILITVNHPVLPHKVGVVMKMDAIVQSTMNVVLNIVLL